MTSVVDRPDTRTLQVPPHSIEAEESVLGAVLLSADAANIALEKLHADDFYRPAHQQIFEAVRGLFDSHEPIDPFPLSSVLRLTAILSLIGGLSSLTPLLAPLPPPSSLSTDAFPPPFPSPPPPPSASLPSPPRAAFPPPCKLPRASHPRPRHSPSPHAPPGSLARPRQPQLPRRPPPPPRAPLFLRAALAP